MGAEILSKVINSQSDNYPIVVAYDTALPVRSFLTAGSVLEAEASQVVGDDENKAEFLHPPFILAFVTTAVTVIMF